MSVFKGNRAGDVICVSAMLSLTGNGGNWITLDGMDGDESYCISLPISEARKMGEELVRLADEIEGKQ